MATLLTTTDTTEHQPPKVTWSEVLKAENKNWDWDEVIKQHAGQPSIERRYALRRYFGLWDDYDPVANAILDLVEAQNELAQAISAEQYVDIDGAPEVGPALEKRAAAAVDLMHALLLETELAWTPQGWAEGNGSND
jgi:hypothetical protein